jgi:hypothetical protein
VTTLHEDDAGFDGDRLGVDAAASEGVGSALGGYDGDEHGDDRLESLSRMMEKLSPATITGAVSLVSRLCWHLRC